MRASWLTLLVAIYVALDVGNPFMPGALTFGVEHLLEVRPADRFRGHDDAVGVVIATPAPRHLEPVEFRETMTRAPAPDVARLWHRPVPHARPSFPAPSLAPEDH